MKGRDSVASDEEKWKIEEDLHTIRRYFELKQEVLKIFNDKDRLAKAKALAEEEDKAKKEMKDALDSGSLASALGTD